MGVGKFTRDAGAGRRMKKGKCKYQHTMVNKRSMSSRGKNRKREDVMESLAAASDMSCTRRGGQKSD